MGADVYFVEALLRLLFVAGIGIARNDPAADRTRFVQRANRPAWFFNDQIEVGLTRPGNLDDHVTDQSLNHFVPKGVVLRLVDRLFQFLQGRQGDASSGFENLLQIAGPGMRQHADRGPANGGHILRALCGTKSQGVGFVIEWRNLDHLAIDFHGATVQLDVRKIPGDEHQFVGRTAEIASRHDGPLDFTLFTARQFHGDAQRFVHPRLGLTMT